MARTFQRRFAPAGERVCCNARVIDVELHWSRVPESGFAELFPSLRADLSDDEIAAAQRFIFERHQLLYAYSHAFLRRILGRSLNRTPREIAIIGNRNERPELADRALRFNLSHTAGLVLIGITASADIGVDAESLERHTDVTALAPNVFTPEECAMWDGTREDFFDRWTLKESYIKARGLGLAIDLQNFGVNPGPPPGLLATDANEWSLFSFLPTATHRAGACVRGREVRWRVAAHPTQ
jgi:4'-phosphopantetheinyl transferase